MNSKIIPILTVLAGGSTAVSLFGAPIVTLDTYETPVEITILSSVDTSDTQVDLAPIGAIGDRTVTLEVFDISGPVSSTSLLALNLSGDSVVIENSSGSGHRFSFEYSALDVNLLSSSTNSFGIFLQDTDIASGQEWDLTIGLTSASVSGDLFTEATVEFSEADIGDFLVIPFVEFAPFGTDFSQIKNVIWSVSPGDSTDYISKDMQFGNVLLGNFDDVVFEPVPEPSTYALFSALALAAGLLIRRRMVAKAA